MRTSLFDTGTGGFGGFFWGRDEDQKKGDAQRVWDAQAMALSHLTSWSVSPAPALHAAKSMRWGCRSPNSKSFPGRPRKVSAPVSPDVASSCFVLVERSRFLRWQNRSDHFTFPVHSNSHYHYFCSVIFALKDSEWSPLLLLRVLLKWGMENVSRFLALPNRRRWRAGRQPYISFSSCVLTTWTPLARAWSCLLHSTSTAGRFEFTTGSSRMLYRYLHRRQPKCQWPFLVSFSVSLFFSLVETT